MATRLKKILIRNQNIRGEEVLIYGVKGTEVRDSLDIDFTAGGHKWVSERYSYIPDSEIWVDSDMNEKDFEATILHEVTEYEKMKYEGWSYDKAHDYASSVELKFRNGKEGKELEKKEDNTLSESYTSNDIATKWAVSEEFAFEQLMNGSKVELEHTKDEVTATTIASQHLYKESPNYYIELEKMENKLKKENVLQHKPIESETKNHEFSYINNKFVENIILSSHDITGKSNKSTTEPIKAAYLFLRRSKKPSENAKRGQSVKEIEKSILIKYIEQYDLFYDVSILQNFLERGQEQKVFYFGEYVIKTNSLSSYASWEAYFISLLLHNYYFPDTQYELLGFVEDLNLLYAIVKQKYVKSDKATTLEDISTYLSNNGFIQVSEKDYLSENGVLLQDLHTENVLISDGIFYFIDTIFSVFNDLDIITLSSNNVTNRILTNLCEYADINNKQLFFDVEDEHIELFKNHGFKIKE